MDATLAIMAARPLYCALPEGLMTTHQRVREVAAVVARDEKNTIVFERPRIFTFSREVWKLAHDSKLENPKAWKTG